MKPINPMREVFSNGVTSDADNLFDNNGHHIADFSGYKTMCRHAAHAINCHDELVESLSDMIEQFADYDDEGNIKPDQFIIVNMAIDILNKAKGKQQ